jgi:hypothetical protein
MTQAQIIGFALIGLSAACGVAAAALHGGLIEALTVASGAFGSMGATWAGVSYVAAKIANPPAVK